MTIDISELKKITSDDKESILNAIDLFVATFEEGFEKVKISKDTSSFTHKIKPSLFYIQIPEISNLIAQFKNGDFGKEEFFTQLEKLWGSAKIILADPHSLI